MRLLVFSSLIVLTFTSRLAAEQAPGTRHSDIEVVTVGGFLGFVDGFDELPGSASEPLPPPAVCGGSQKSLTGLAGSSRSQLGGLLGVERWLREHRGSAVLLVAGNNFSHDFASRVLARPEPNDRLDEFWRRLAAAKPDVVALSGDDFHRVLRPLNADSKTGRRAARGRTWRGAPAFAEWVAWGARRHDRLPLLASNAVIKLHGEGLNTIRAGDVTLEIPEVESIPWVSTLTFVHPCRRTSILRDRDNYRITAHGAAMSHEITVKGAVVKRDADPDADELEDPCHSEVGLGAPLRPGAKYGIDIAGVGRFTLWTHQALTPLSGGLPMATTRIDGLPVAITALVDPAVKATLPPESWQWGNERTQSSTPGHLERGGPDRFEIDFLKPAEAIAMLRALSVAPDSSETALQVLVSALPEPATSEVLATYPEFRVIVLDPDSELLGRASTGKKGELSGDLGTTAVVDRAQPLSTKIVMRPEWIGEVAVSAKARVSAAARVMELQSPRVKATLVPGAALCPTVSREGVRYTAQLGDERVELPGGVKDRPWFDPYPSLAHEQPFDDRCEAQGNLWTDGDEFVSLILDTMRRKARAELALVPAQVVDADVMEWIGSHAKRNEPVNWLSRFILERAVYRSERFTRVIVKGRDLVATVNDIIDDGSFCLAGFGNKSCGTKELDAEHLQVNERVVRDWQYYGVAVPVGVALEHGLTPAPERSFDLIDALDERLSSKCVGGAGPTVVSLSERLQTRIARRLQHYIRLEPLSVEYSRVSLEEPPGRTGIFRQLPVDANSSNESRKWTLGVNADFAFVDSRRFAGRTVGELKFDSTRVGDQRSVADDEFLLGLRGDWKRLPGLQHGRVFAGFFLDGQTGVKSAALTATRAVSNVVDPADPTRTIAEVTQKGPTLSFDVPPARYRYGAVGVEADVWSIGWLTVADLRVAGHVGRAHNVPVAVRLGSSTFGIGDYRQKGAQKLLDEAFAIGPDSLSASTVYRYEVERRPQRRFQIDARTEAKLGWWTDGLKVGTSTRLRFYDIEEQPDLSPNWSLRLIVDLKVPLMRRWAVSPYVEWQTVDVKGIDNGNFNYYKYGLKTEWTTLAKWGRGRLWQ